MKKLRIFIIVLLIILAGGLLFFYKNKINTPAPSNNNQTQVPSQQTDFSVLAEKDFISLTGTESYNLGQVEFVIHAPKDDMQSMGYFEVKQNGVKVFSSEPNYQITGLLSFSFGENKYVVVKDYSGGAHCCDTDYLFRINGQGQVKLIKKFDMGNTTIAKDNLLFKNHKLYFILTDDSFQYFHAPFADSYFFEQYLELRGDDVVLANKDFSSELIGRAEMCTQQLAEDTQAVKSDATLTINSWLPNALCRITNYTLAGSNLAWQGFEEYFNVFKTASPTSVQDYLTKKSVDVATLKKEITEILQNERFK